MLTCCTQAGGHCGTRNEAFETKLCDNKCRDGVEFCSHSLLCHVTLEDTSPLSCPPLALGPSYCIITSLLCLPLIVGTGYHISDSTFVDTSFYILTLSCFTHCSTLNNTVSLQVTSLVFPLTVMTEVHFGLPYTHCLYILTLPVAS